VNARTENINLINPRHHVSNALIYGIIMKMISNATLANQKILQLFSVLIIPIAIA
jgi:hypothetical protein